MPAKNLIKATELSVSLPFGIGGIKLELDKAHRYAAWQLYVELVTRVAIQDLHPQYGLMREIMNSLYSFFEITRKILKDCGPEIVDGPHSLGPVAIEILNKGLRPFLTEWHTRLKVYEETRPSGMSQYEHERSWEYYKEMREALKQTQDGLRKYADVLAQIAGAKPIHNETK